MAQSDADRGRLRRAAQAARERIRAARQSRIDYGLDLSTMDDDDIVEADRHDDADVPYGLRTSAAWGWRILVHPLAVIVAIATGIVLAGIIGALVAVPVVAVLNTAIRHFGQRRPTPPPDSVVIRADPEP